MSKDIFLTQEGYEKLKAELDELKGPTRMRIADAIREAKSHGDLRENAAYHEAKHNQGRIEGRIADLEKILAVARVVETMEDHASGANLGNTITLKDLEWGDEMTIKLVGSFEADPANDLISIASPLGAAILGKEVGDEFEVDAPAGKQRYKVLGVE